MVRIRCLCCVRCCGCAPADCLAVIKKLLLAFIQVIILFTHMPHKCASSLYISAHVNDRLLYNSSGSSNREKVAVVVQNTSDYLSINEQQRDFLTT
jgi:hypothetical protein